MVRGLGMGCARWLIKKKLFGGYYCIVYQPLSFCYIRFIIVSLFPYPHIYGRRIICLCFYLLSCTTYIRVQRPHLVLVAPSACCKYPHGQQHLPAAVPWASPRAPTARHQCMTRVYLFVCVCSCLSSV